MKAPSTSNLSVITATSYRRKIWLLYLFLPFIIAYAGRVQVHERVKILLLEVFKRGLTGL